MMQLVMIASFLVLLCGLFDSIAAVNNDSNTTTSSNINWSSISDFFFPPNSCVHGVKSVSLVLFTSNIPNGQVVEVNKSCNLFDPSKPVIFLSNGYRSNATAYNFSVLASTLIKKDYTVFSIDWANASCRNDPTTLNRPTYPFAAINSRIVGEVYLASFIKSVIDVCGVPMRNITLMGHCLGAHISGFAAKKLYTMGYDKPPLLIGADPIALPFEIVDCSNRFCKTDAKRVIALHTSVFGIQRSIADLDLWFNDGPVQPGCGMSDLTNLLPRCSHYRAIDYVILLNNYSFVGVRTTYRLVRNPFLPFLESLGCFSNKTDLIVDDEIFNGNKTGDYCISVSSEYPYYTTS
ncbi:PREDICTED: phospholipase A1-like [Vollenhovia emeryi]|uniref:phospholipase A1-like n=1 Tax=Vollenhovia emeryi TaxID=411798 RepID=UPI0005F3ECA2|nr:PREDICTED: phospholipase A1-like [Vollenhovia emeryi]